MEAGYSGDTGPSTAARTACALRASGTERMTHSARMIWRTLMEMAFGGTGPDAVEPALAGLLPATGLVERNQEGIVGVEIGGRIVKGEGAVFADAHEAQIDGPALQKRVQPRDLDLEIGGVALNRHELRHAGQRLQKALAYVAPEACRWVAGRPTYSSRWNTVTFRQSISAFVRCASISN